MPLYSVAGLATKIDLPVPLIIDLIPASQTNNRPGITLSKPYHWVQHETGNVAPGTGARWHSQWLRQQTNTQVSFHFAVDDKVIYQMVPVNEVTWQAADGSGPGNMSGVSGELCVNRDADKALSRRNAEALAGAICKELVIPVSRVKRHWDFNQNDPNRHHCPDQMMNDGYWPTFQRNVGAIIAGGNPTPSPTTTAAPVYATPDVPPWLTDEELAKGIDRKLGTSHCRAARRSFTVHTQTARRKYATLDSLIVGPDLLPGETFIGHFVFENEGERWILTKQGTRIRNADCYPLVVVTG